jgi:AraC-like DNA-binding protein
MQDEAWPFEETREIAVRLAGARLSSEQARLADEQARREARLADPRGRDAASHRYRAAFLEQAAAIVGDPCFGLHLALETDPRQFGAIYYVFAASDTALDAVRNGVRYSRIVNSAETFSLDETDETLSIEGVPIEGLAGLGPQLSEWSDAILIEGLRDLTGVRLAPTSLSFVAQRRSGAAELEGFFGCPLRYGANRRRLTFAKDSLRAPIRTADPYLLRMVRKFCDEALQRRGADPAPLRARAEKIIVELLPRGKATVDNVAGALAMSPRTFARRLAEEKTSYAALVDDLRRDLAMRYLEDQNLELTQIAWLLGYSEVSSFNHAFRRWSHVSPKVVRAKILGASGRGPAA